jgi:hypothetical protein
LGRFRRFERFRKFEVKVKGEGEPVPHSPFPVFGVTINFTLPFVATAAFTSICL